MTAYIDPEMLKERIKEVEDNTIFVTGTGSRLYGIHNEDSDFDKTGVMMPTLKSLLKADLGVLSTLENPDQFKYPDTDYTVFDIRKVFRILIDNGPNMFDLLYSPESAIIKNTPIWEEVRANRDIFVSKKCRYTFSGYAVSQLLRIKTHRSYLLDPPTIKPERSNFKLPPLPIFPSAQIKGVLSSVLTIVQEDRKPLFIADLDKVYRDYVSPLLAEYVVPEERTLAYEWLLAGIKSQASTLLHIPSYVKEEYIEMARREISFYQANNEWSQYCTWKKNRNKSRAVLEEKFGYDTKHACHLVRLLRCGVELLETGSLSVDRRGIDADELKFIRSGGWSFEKIEEYCSTMDKKLEEAYTNSKIQLIPNSEKAYELCYRLVENYMNKRGL